MKTAQIQQWHTPISNNSLLCRSKCLNVCRSNADNVQVEFRNQVTFISIALWPNVVIELPLSTGKRRTQSATSRTTLWTRHVRQGSTEGEPQRSQGLESGDGTCKVRVCLWLPLSKAGQDTRGWTTTQAFELSVLSRGSEAQSPGYSTERRGRVEGCPFEKGQKITCYSLLEDWVIGASHNLSL